MTNEDVLSLRLFNQHLTGEKFKNPQDAVKWFCAIQSQDYPGARWGLGQRVSGTTDLTIQKDYDEGRILRTHVMRPTWHFVHPDDIYWMLNLTSDRIKRVMEYYNKSLGLDLQVFEKSNKIISKRLSNNNFATRKELAESLNSDGIDTTGTQRLGHLVGWAELDGIICSGPMRGKQFTYALLSERAPHGKKLTRDQALKELTQRYFQSHGPAGAKDFSWWSGLTMKDSLSGIGMVKGMTEDKAGKVKLYYFKKDFKKMSDKVYLLPNYDEYGIAYQDRSHFFNDENTKHLGVRGNANFQHMLVTNGSIFGTWKKTIKKDTVLLDILLFNKPSHSKHDLIAEAVDEYAKFLKLNPQINLKVIEKP